MLKKMHNRLYNKLPFVYYFLSYFFNHWKPRTTKDINLIISNYAKVKSEGTFFLQIGANDGVTNDPLHKNIIENKWSGVLIEPIDFLFESLKKNYINKEGLIFLNAAIGDSDGTSTIYTVDEKMRGILPDWCFQLTSFNKEVILSHKMYEPRIEFNLREKVVTTYSIRTLQDLYDLKKVDLIHIDTEGYDFEIMKQIDFSVLKPDIILFESKHLTDNDYKICIKMLKRHGYSLLADEYDTIGVKEDHTYLLKGIKKNFFFQRKM